MKHKIYLLVLDWAGYDDHDICIDVYTTREAAREAMRKEYEEYKQEYLSDYEEDCVICDDFDDDSRMLQLDGSYDERHDSWTIMEKEVEL